MANYIPHADLDPYATYHQQPTYAGYNHPANYPQPPPQGQPQRYHHAPQQYFHVPDQAHGHGHGPPASGSMPPPSTIPDSSHFHRQTYAHPSAPQTPDRWPLGLTDEQRQLQEQYHQQSQTPHLHPNYHQPSPFSGPVSTFPPPSQKRTSPEAQPPPQSPRVSQPPPPTLQKSQQPMTVTTAKAAPPPNPSLSTVPTDPAKSVPASTASPNLEAQRVTALLDLNRVLLQEVVKDQAAQKAVQSQPKPAQKIADTASKPDAPPAAKQENDIPTEDAKNLTSAPPNLPQNTPAHKTPHTKEYVEYMRRLQANLAYLASVADRHHKPGNAVPPFPAIMEAPSLAPPPAPKEKSKVREKDARENIRELYARLRDLWPEYKVKGQVPMQGTLGQTPVTTGAV
ncbi:MAG: hypothetical protein Q9170_000306 [Blastenia crenularia]